MEARLILLDPPAARREVRLALPSTIGRSRDAKIKLVHGQVSRVHCEFFERDGLLHVRDLGSTNGTYVGEERIDESAVAPGDTVTIGAVRFRAEYEPADDAILPAEVLEPTGTVRAAAEATFRARPPAAVEDETETTTAGSDATGAAEPDEAPPILSLDGSGDMAGLPSSGILGTKDSTNDDSDFPRASEWDELEEFTLESLDDASTASNAPTADDSLHIFPATDDAAAANQPTAELKWHAPEIAEADEQSDESNVDRTGSSPGSSAIDDDFDRFLQSLDDDKSA